MRLDNQKSYVSWEDIAWSIHVGYGCYHLPKAGYCTATTFHACILLHQLQHTGTASLPYNPFVNHAYHTHPFTPTNEEPGKKAQQDPSKVKEHIKATFGSEVSSLEDGRGGL